VPPCPPSKRSAGSSADVASAQGVSPVHERFQEAEKVVPSVCDPRVRLCRFMIRWPATPQRLCSAISPPTPLGRCLEGGPARKHAPQLIVDRMASGVDVGGHGCVRTDQVALVRRHERLVRVVHHLIRSPRLAAHHRGVLNRTSPPSRDWTIPPRSLQGRRVVPNETASRRARGRRPTPHQADGRKRRVPGRVQLANPVGQDPRPSDGEAVRAEAEVPA